MEKNILIFLPNTLNKNEEGFIKGFYRIFDTSEAYYITSDRVLKKYNKDCIGCLNQYAGKPCYANNTFLRFNTSNNKISVTSPNISSRDIVFLTYDYNSFKKSHVTELEHCGIHFRILSNELRRSNNTVNNGRKSVFIFIVLWSITFIDFLLKVLATLRKLFCYSTTYVHFEESMTSLRWCLNASLEPQPSPKLGSIFTSKIIDIILGIILINFLLKHENGIMYILGSTTEGIISNLKGLLLYLMGSPIGLKLNYAFNKSLGQFFFYHISLWRIFLHAMQPLFCSYFKYFVLPGVLGFSFHLALLSDIISMATFHVYCIYVYAARLFNLQLRGLGSLWRLLIGRKYNPLRERIDSCQYTPNQLFIGTLGFTVLLFLLPTTVMYYTVFSMFRFIILLLDEILVRTRYFLSIIPLYVFILWIFKSPSIAGQIHMEWQSNENNVTNVEIKLDTLPLVNCIKKCIPNNLEQNKTLSNHFHCMITGTLV